MEEETIQTGERMMGEAMQIDNRGNFGLCGPEAAIGLDARESP